MWLFLETLFIITKNWKQWRRLSVGERFKKLIYPNNGILFNDKRNELARQRKICMNFKCTLLKEKCQSEKATYCVSPTIWNSGKHKTVEWVNTPVVAKGCRRGKVGIDEIKQIF